VVDRRGQVGVKKNKNRTYVSIIVFYHRPGILPNPPPHRLARVGVTTQVAVFFLQSMPWAEKHNIYRKNIITPKKKQEKEKKLPWVEQREKTGPCMVAIFFPTLTWIGAPLKKDISLSTQSAKALRAKKTSLSRRITLYTQLGLVQNYPVTPRRTPTLSRISSELSRIITRCTRAHADIRIYQKYPVTPRRLNKNRILFSACGRNYTKRK